MKSKLLGTTISGLLLGMSSFSALANIALDERTIPTPAGISVEFAELLENRVVAPAIPAPKTQQDWLDLQVMFDAPGIAIAVEAAERLEVTYESRKFAGVDTFIVTPKTVSEEYKDKYLVHIHGGAFVFGGGESALREAIWVANGLGAKVISVDYRQPPLHPFPAAIDDAVAVWKELTKTQAAESTAIFGSSAGGNLTLATTLKLQELDLPFQVHCLSAPQPLILNTPQTLGIP
ncbi:alpha/beta hydrolase fold domain-containing protein [Vibrio breoganii]|uniref:alpha/beta hydrolase fold domain-containing protein n=1 Tax=Vibrio breoganii TaxID=553239 RepID=UPI0039A67C9B